MSAPVPAVSVVMPAWNAARTIDAAVRSVLAQTFTDFELIVVDDGSTDDTGPMLERLAASDARIKVVRGAHGGISAAANLTTEHARAPWLARLDSDDIAHPNRLAVQLAAVANHPDVVLLGSHAALIDSDGRPFTYRMELPLEHDEMVALLLDGGWPIIHPSVLIRRDALEAVGGYDVEMPMYEDHDVFLRLAERGRLQNLADELVDYRVHLYSQTKRKITSTGYKTACIARARERRLRAGLPEPKRSKVAGMITYPRSMLYEVEVARSLFSSAVSMPDRARAGWLVARRIGSLLRAKARRKRRKLKRRYSSG